MFGILNAVYRLLERNQQRRWWWELALFVVVHFVVIALMVLAMYCAVQASSSHTVIRGCVIAVDGTVNNRDEVVYFNCGNQVAFQLVGGSVSVDIMKGLEGKTVDVKLEVIK